LREKEAQAFFFFCARFFIGVGGALLDFLLNKKRFKVSNLNVRSGDND